MSLSIPSELKVKGLKRPLIEEEREVDETVALIKRKLEEGSISVNARSVSYKGSLLTPLQFCICQDRIEDVKSLVEVFKASIHPIYQDDLAPLDLALDRGMETNDFQISEYLYTRGASDVSFESVLKDEWKEFLKTFKTKDKEIAIQEIRNFLNEYPESLRWEFFKDGKKFSFLEFTFEKGNKEIQFEVTSKITAILKEELPKCQSEEEIIDFVERYPDVIYRSVQHGSHQISFFAGALQKGYSKVVEHLTQILKTKLSNLTKEVVPKEELIMSFLQAFSESIEFLSVGEKSESLLDWAVKNNLQSLSAYIKGEFDKKILSLLKNASENEAELIDFLRKHPEMIEEPLLCSDGEFVPLLQYAAIKNLGKVFRYIFGFLEEKWERLIRANPVSEIEIIRFLSENPDKINAYVKKDSDSQVSFLVWAAQNLWGDVVRFLLDHSELNADEDLDSHLPVICQVLDAHDFGKDLKKDEKVKDILLSLLMDDKIESINQGCIDNGGIYLTPLMRYIERHDLNRVKILVEDLGADVNFCIRDRDFIKWNSLTYALDSVGVDSEEEIEETMALLEAGGNVEKGLEIVKYLKDHGALL